MKSFSLLSENGGDVAKRWKSPFEIGVCERLQLLTYEYGFTWYHKLMNESYYESVTIMSL